MIVYKPNTAHNATKKSDVLHYASGGEQRTTNNRMELTAALETLRRCSQFLTDSPGTPIIVHTDSTYVHDALTQYLDRRVAKNRKLANRRPVQNRDLREQVVPYKKLIGELSRQRVKAHAYSAQNNAVDRLARKAATEQQDALPYDFVPPAQVSGVSAPIDGPQQSALW